MTCNRLGLMLLIPLVSALTDSELSQFIEGDGYNRTVNVTNLENGTLVFRVYKPCYRKDNNLPDDKPAYDFPSLPDIPGFPAIPPGFPSSPERLNNCTDEEISLTVNSNPVAIQDPDQPSPIPSLQVLGMGLDGYLIRTKETCRRGRGKGRACSRRRFGGRGRGRGRGRKGRRGKRFIQWHGEREREYMAILVAQDQLLGVALDGFPIYSANSSEVPDRLLQLSDLDQCGGRCDVNGNYRYHAVRLGDDNDGDSRVMIHLGCIKGVMVEPAITGIEKHWWMREGYKIACSANSTVGSCVSAATVNQTAYECFDFSDDSSSSLDSDSSSSSDRDADSSSGSHEDSDSSSSSDGGYRNNGRQKRPRYRNNRRRNKDSSSESSDSS